MKHLYLILFALACTITAHAQYTISADDVDFDPQTGTISNYTNAREKNIIIPEQINGAQVRVIDLYAFYSNQITEVSIPQSVTKIGHYAFASNELTSIKIPDSVIEIGDNAFAYNEIESVTIPTSVVAIGNYAFASNRLTSMTIPKSVSVIGAYAFASRKQIRALITQAPPEGEAPFSSEGSGKGIELPKRDEKNKAVKWWAYDIESEGFILFDTATKTKPIIADYTKGYTNDIEELKKKMLYTPTTDDLKFDESTGTIISYKNMLERYIVIPSEINGTEVKAIGDRAFEKNELHSVVIPNTVTSIGDYAFYGNALTSVELPNSVKEIGNFAFYRNMISHVDIPNSVSYIGDFSFAINSLKEVDIPKSVSVIGAYAFANKKEVIELLSQFNAVDDQLQTKEMGNYLVSIKLPKKGNDKEALQWWSYNKNYSKDGDSYEQSNMSKTKPLITDFTKRYCTEAPEELAPYVLTAKDVKFKPETGEIDKYLNTEQKNIIIPQNIDGVEVREIGYNAFSDCELTAVVLPSSIKLIGAYAFKGNKLRTIELPKSVIEIGNNAFEANQLSEVVIPDSITEIESGLFYKNELTKVIIPLSVVKIGEYAFAFNQLSKLEIPRSVLEIKSGAFYSNKLSRAPIPPFVTKIEQFTFTKNDITSRKLRYHGNYQLPEGWCEADSTIELPASTYQYKLTSNDVEFDEETGTIISYKNPLEKAIIIPSKINGHKVLHIGDYAFSRCKLVSLELPNTLISIGDLAFDFNKLQELIIPNSVTSIGANAFSSNLIRHVVLPNSITNLGATSFYSNRLTSVVIPNSVTEIKWSVFGSNLLRSVEIPSTVTKIGRTAFQYNRLKEISIPNSVTSIGAEAFLYNPMESLPLPSKNSSGQTLQWYSYEFYDAINDNHKTEPIITDFERGYTTNKEELNDKQ